MLIEVVCVERLLGEREIEIGLLVRTDVRESAKEIVLEA